jgi:hypothetical protein
MGCKTLHFFSPVQMGLPRELAESLTGATQPGLVSPGVSDQAQRYYPASGQERPRRVGGGMRDT